MLRARLLENVGEAKPVVRGGLPPAAVRGGLPPPAAGAAVFLALCRREGNVASSPASLEIALSMAAAGASVGTRTYAELCQALGHTGEEHEVHARLAGIIQLLLGCGSRKQMLVANSLWVSGGVQEEFVECCKRVFSADVYRLQSAQIINAWVAANTRNEIRELLSTDPTDSVLLNALYFKANWHTPFDPKKTKTALFRSLAGDSECRMMHIPALQCTRGDTKHACYVVVPYEQEHEDGGFCALVVLPHSPGAAGLLAAATDLFGTPDGIHDAVNRAVDDRVRLSMPVFEIDSPVLSLKAELQALGVNGLFTSCELGRMSSKTTTVSDVKQKMVVRVDETGTVAAAATVVQTTRGGGGGARQMFELVVDRPFLFVVFDELSRTTLFAAKVATVSGSSHPAPDVV